MNEKPSNRTRHVAFRVSPHDYQTLAGAAERDRKPVREWCRDKIVEALRPKDPSPFYYALMAEISATETILIDLLCALGRDGKISQQKAQTIVDAAHNTKYKEAAELLKYAYTQSQNGRVETASEQSTGTKRSPHELA